jgi:predicted O-methyltransferase YrrM
MKLFKQESQELFLNLVRLILSLEIHSLSFFLGTFLGYSSLRIASQLPNDARFITIEADSQSAEIARSLHEYAGVADRIKIVKGYTENIIPHLNKDFHIDSFDLIFIDHHKAVYLRDFKLLEDYGLIKSGTMIVADNVIYPGAPDYLEYVRNNPNYTTKMYEAMLEYRDDTPDGGDFDKKIKSSFKSCYFFRILFFYYLVNTIFIHILNINFEVPITKCFRIE